jgi:phosphoribosylanthranilate isomerase
MFRIKICGITNVDDARVASEAGADAIGLNFYMQSKRFVDVMAARQIAESLPPNVTKVGVFVNSDAALIAAMVAEVGLDCVQLHGDEPADLPARLALQLPVVRAFRCGGAGLAPLVDHLAACRSAGRVPDALLLDADASGQFGGTGRIADWNRIASERHLVEHAKILLGGGLNPANVAEAIRVVRPHGVDVASGVEREPGRKDATLVQEFVANAHVALAAVR